MSGMDSAILPRVPLTTSSPATSSDESISVWKAALKQARLGFDSKVGYKTDDGPEEIRWERALAQQNASMVTGR